MPSLSMVYEFIIYDDASSPILTVTSVRGGTNPFIAEPPNGDGLEFDPVAGTLRTGAYTVQITDPILSGTSRLVTSVLADAGFRNQLLSRAARVRQSTDGGATWSVLINGYVTSLRLTDAITWSFTVGDTRRIEQTRVVFASDDPTYFPIRGARFGGPIVGGSIGPVPARLGGAFVVRQVTGRDVGMDFVVGLDPLGKETQYFGQFAEGIAPKVVQGLPARGGLPGFFVTDDPGARGINQWAEPYFVVDENTDYRYRFPLLRYRVAALLTGVQVGSFVPIVPPQTLLFGPATLTGRGGMSNERTIHMEWTGTLPSVGQRFWVSLLTNQSSEDCPLYISDHPVNVVRKLYQQAGIPINSASFDDVRDLLGFDLRVTFRITSPQTMLPFLESSLLGPFGIGIRNNQFGEIEAFNARIKLDTLPTVTVNTTDLIDDVAEVFDLDESTVINRIVLESLNLTPVLNGPRNLSKEDVQSLPRNGFFATRNTVEATPRPSEVTTYGTREIRYSIPGMVHTRWTFQPQTQEFVKVLGEEVYNRYGRGMQAADLRVRRGASADAVKVGDEIYVQPAHLPNRNKRLGDDPSVGARIMQVVRRTDRPDSIELRCLDSGTNAQPGVAPTISVAASSALPSTVAVFTLTNAATLNAVTGLGVAVEWAASPTTPTTNGVSLTYGAPDIPTGGVSLPPVDPGVTVWVRARTEAPDLRPSAWTAWTSVTLSALSAPTGLAASAITQDSAVLSWTNTNTTQRVRVSVAPSAASDTAGAEWTITDLTAGSTRITAANLQGPSVAYTARVAYLTDEGLVGSAATTTFTTGTNTLTAPRPAGLQVLTGSAAGDVAAFVTGCAVGVWAADTAMALIVERAPDVANAPGTYAQIDIVPGTTEVYVDSLPNNGASYWYRFKHRASGYSDSAATCGKKATVSGIPAGLTRGELVLPSVRAENSEVGTTATVTLDIDDPQCRVVEVRFRHRVQPSAWSSYTVDTTVPYSYSETIPTAGFLEIEWEVRGYDSTGTLVTLATAIEYFDADTVSDMASVVGTFGSAGTLLLAFTADTDTASMRYAVSTTSQPDATATAAGTLINARTGTATLAGPYAIGTTVYVSVIAYTGANGTGTASALFPYSFLRGGYIAPTVVPVVFEDPATRLATLTLEVTDPQSVVTEVAFRFRDNGGTWSSYVADPSAPYTTTRTIPLNGFTELGWRVTGTNATGASVVLASGSEYFDDDTRPDLVSVVGTYTQDGALVLAFSADTDTLSVRYAVSTSSQPSLGTTQAGTLINARTGTATLTGPYAYGATVYVSVLAYGGANASGVESSLYEYRFVRDGEDIRITETLSETATSGTLALAIADPQARVTLVEARTQVGHAAFGSYTTLSNSGTSTAKAYSVSVTLVEKVPSKIEYRVTATTPTGGTSYYATNAVTFAMGTKPFIPDLFVTVREDGTVDALVQGDSDTASVRIGYSTASQATADTNAASATAVNGRTRTALNIGSLALGQKAFVSALAYSGTGGTGEVSEVAQAEIVRANVSSTRTVRWNTAGAFQPQFPSTTSVARDLFGYIPMINLNGTAFHFATLPVPIGATLQAVTVRVNLLLAFGGTGSVTMRLYRLQDDGDSTQLGTDQVISANGTQTLTVGSLSESVTATRSYVVELQADSSDTDNLATAFYSDITYLSPNLTVNL